MEGESVLNSRYSPHLPPLDAWKDPEKWLDIETGRPLEGIEKLKLPVDDRGIVQTYEAVEYVKTELFLGDYDWRNGDDRLLGDIHHFYHPSADYDPEVHGGNELPFVFRRVPALMGRMPRLFHNALHDFTEAPKMPSYDVMEEYRRSYLLAHRAFANLIRLANSTTYASKQFQLRQHSLDTGRVIPKDPEDQVGKEFLRESFSRHFSHYSETVELVRSLQEEGIVVADIPDYLYSRPHLVAKKVGYRTMKNYINYLPQFTNKSLGKAA